MCRVLGVALLLGLAIACDDGGGAKNFGDTAEFDTDGRIDDGTQIGSEGLLDCGDSEVLGDLDAVVGEFPDTPGDMRSALTGELDGTNTPMGGDPADAALALVPTPGADMSRSSDLATCEESLHAPIDAKLTGPLVAAPMTGSIDIGVHGRGEIHLQAALVDVTGAQPAFDSTGMDEVRLELRGQIDNRGLNGEFVFVGCNGADCISETVSTLNLERP